MDARKLPPKYITVNGVMKLNPDYTAAKAREGAPTTVAAPTQALAIVSTAEEMMAASDLMKQKTGKPIEISASNDEAVKIIQNAEFLDKFNAPRGIDAGDLMDGLYNVFAKYETPAGQINKLLECSERKMLYIMDNSGSMQTPTRLTFRQSSVHLQKQMRPGQTLDSVITRWQEAQDRLHNMIDLLGYIPTNGITLQYLNQPAGRPNFVDLNQRGQNPEDFIRNAHEQVVNFFSVQPFERTPIYRALNTIFNEAREPMIINLFTDGQPTDASIEQVANLIKNRKNPKDTAVILTSCSDDDDDTLWLKKVEEEAPYVAEIDDYASECKEVLQDQGPAFPYSKGLWLICNLVAAVCPADLDAIDESVPFSNFTLGNILGRKLNEQEFKHYFDLNPHRNIWAPLYTKLSREEVVSVELAADIRKMHGFSKETDIQVSHVSAYAARFGASSSAQPGYVSAPQNSYMGPPPSYAQTVSTFAPQYDPYNNPSQPTYNPNSGYRPGGR